MSVVWVTVQRTAPEICALCAGATHSAGFAIFNSLELDSSDVTQNQAMTHELMHMPMTLTLIQIIFINE